jgi:hypothetical protein
MRSIYDWNGLLYGTTTITSGPDNTETSTLTTADNITMTTPLCTLRALQQFGATSTVSVLIVGMCIMYRSVQRTT